MTNDHRPLRPPDPVGAPCPAAPGGEEDPLHQQLAVQRNRALVYSFAGGATLLSKLTGIARFNALASLAVLGLGYLSVLLFTALLRRQRRGGRRRPLEVWWIGCDVLLITAMIWLTGGVTSPWFLWYLACAGAAAAHCSERVSLAGAGLTALLYFAVLTAMRQIRGFDSGLFHASGNLLFLLGSSLFLLLNTRRLRQSVVVNRQLRRQAVERVEELTRVTRDLEAMSRLLQDFTEKDPLTGLHNRRYFMDRVAADAERFGSERRSSNQRRTTGLIMLDLDNFKGINDSHGHPAGDQLLKHLARVLRGCVRGDDRVVRWGGDEFVILLPHTAEEMTGQVAERLVRTVRAEPVRLAGGGVWALSCSAGWSMIDWAAPAGAKPPWEGARAAAEAALYLSKAAGGNCSRFLAPVHEDGRPAPPRPIAGTAGDLAQEDVAARSAA